MDEASSVAWDEDNAKDCDGGEETVSVAFRGGTFAAAVVRLAPNAVINVVDSGARGEFLDTFKLQRCHLDVSNLAARVSRRGRGWGQSQGRRGGVLWLKRSGVIWGGCLAICRAAASTFCDLFFWNWISGCEF